MPNKLNYPRPLREIAKAIHQHWPEPYFAAVPYIKAMLYLDSIHGSYGLDSAEEIVLRFLANAGTWRGYAARTIKSELRAHLDKLKEN